MENAIHQENHKGFLIKIFQDTDSECPYDSWDMLGTMYHWHRRGFIGEDLARMDREDIAAKIADIRKGGGEIMAIYLYEHGGQTISAAPFSCPWDSGQVGFWAVTGEEIRREYSVKRITKKTREKVREVIKGQIQSIDDYLTGNVYGFVIEKPDGEHVDSCWGFYGDYSDDCLKEARTVADHAERAELPLLAAGGLLDEKAGQCAGL